MQLHGEVVTKEVSNPERAASLLAVHVEVLARETAKVERSTLKRERERKREGECSKRKRWCRKGKRMWNVKAKRINRNENAKENK